MAFSSWRLWSDDALPIRKPPRWNLNSNTKTAAVRETAFQRCRIEEGWTWRCHERGRCVQRFESQVRLWLHDQRLMHALTRLLTHSLSRSYTHSNTLALSHSHSLSYSHTLTLNHNHTFTLSHTLNLFHNFFLSLRYCNRWVYCIYLDLKKDFHKVWHSRFIWKLEDQGVKGKLLEWMKDFWIERQMSTLITRKLYMETSTQLNISRISLSADSVHHF